MHFPSPSVGHIKRWGDGFRLEPVSELTPLSRRPATALVGAVPKQPLVLGGAGEGGEHRACDSPQWRRRQPGRRWRRPSARLRQSAVGIGVDPGAVGVFGRGPSGDVAADIPIDPEARQQRRDQALPRVRDRPWRTESWYRRDNRAPPRRSRLRRDRRRTHADSARAARCSTATAPSADWANACNVPVSGALAAAIASARENWPR